MHTDHLVVLSAVALDQRNGGGMVSLCKHLSIFSAETKITSIFFNRFSHQDGKGLNRKIDFIHLECESKGRCIFRFFKKVKSLSKNNLTVLILPTQLFDLILGVLMTLFSYRVLVWCMDDFIDLGTRKGFRLGLKVFLKEIFFSILYRKASGRMVIGPQMNLEYQHRYGVAAEHILANTWPEETLLQARAKTSGQMKLVWIGNFLPHYEEPLRKIIDLITSEKINASLDFWGFRAPPESWVNQKGIGYRGKFESKNLPHILSQYDFALLTYSFDQATIKYMRFSFPGKLIDYLCSATPVITISPAELKFLDEVKKNDVGPILNSIDDQGLISLFQALEKNLNNPFLEWSKNANSWASRSFTLEKSLIGFNKLLQAVIEK